MYLSYFPTETIALQQEILKHPELVKKLESAGVMEQDISSKLAMIATHCNVVVDGDYTVDDIIGLCGHLTEKLQQMRTITVLPTKQ